MKTKLLLAAVIAMGLNAAAQTTSQADVVEPMEHTPTFGSPYQPQRAGGQLSAPQRSHDAGFVGTSLMPLANGEAKVESERGSIKVGLSSATCGAPSPSATSI